MRKKRAKKRTANRRPMKAKRVRARDPRRRTEVVTVTFPRSVAHFLRGVSDYSSIPIDLLVNSLLAVQVHAMREKS